jgi:hypothetical protein
MNRDVLNGVLAGAAGTAMLNAATYGDMVLRNRPPSDLPQKMVDTFARALHAPPPPENRRTGLGALLGYADGFGVGAVFGMIRPRTRAVPWIIAAFGLAAFTMLLSEGSATAARQTDPKTWGVEAWMADVVPRVFYGAVTCLTFDLLSES